MPGFEIFSDFPVQFCIDQISHQHVKGLYNGLMVGLSGTKTTRLRSLRPYQFAMLHKK